MLDRPLAGAIMKFFTRYTIILLSQIFPTRSESEQHTQRNISSQTHSNQKRKNG